MLDRPPAEALFGSSLSRPVRGRHRRRHRPHHARQDALQRLVAAAGILHHRWSKQRSMMA
jgi:hypothetical protein